MDWKTCPECSGFALFLSKSSLNWPGLVGKFDTCREYGDVHNDDQVNVPLLPLLDSTSTQKYDINHDGFCDFAKHFLCLLRT